MSYYIENAYLEEVRRQSLKKDEERIKKIELISKKKGKTDNIHVIFFDIYLHTTNRKDIIPTVKNIINMKEDHFIIILYCDNIRCLTPILPLNDKTIKLVSKVLDVTNYESIPRIQKEDIKELVKTKAIMNVPSLEFLKDYSNVFFYE